MAKRHLEQYDKNGNMLDIYLNEEEVMVGDQTLAEKLADMEDDIDDAAQTGGEGTVTGIKVGSNTYEPTEGVVDISGAVPTSTSDLNNNSDFTTKAYVDAAVQAVQTALNNLLNGQSVTDAIDTFNEIVDFLNGIDTDDPTLANQLLALNNAISAVQTSLAAKANSADVYTKTEVDTKVADAGKVKSVSVNNGTPSQPDAQGNVNLTFSGGGDTDIVGLTVPSPNDGTVVFTKRNNDTVTVNLNHTHPQYLKYELLADEAAYTALATKDSSTLYLIPETT